MLLLILACAEECDPAKIDGPTGVDASVHVCPCDEGTCYAAEGFDASETFESGQLRDGCYVVAMEWTIEDGGQRCAMEWLSDPVDVGCGDHRSLVWEDGASSSVCEAL